jgi:hypothetical protein
MTWGSVLVQAALAAPVFGQTPASKPEELFATIRPHLEAVLGGRLQRLPVFRSAKPADLAALPDGLVDLQVACQFHDLDDATRDRLRTAATSALRGAAVAALQEGTDSILVVPDNAAQIARWDVSLTAVPSEAFLRLALVHETMRWILDQQYDLPKRRAACRDSEELVALQAVIEGRCQWVTRQVARRLGDEATFALLAEVYRHVPDTRGEGTERVLCHDVQMRRQWCCTKGMAFFDYLDKAGVKDAEARAFVHPPRLATWIERPELYLRSERLNLHDLGELLTRLEGELPAEEWQAVQQPWTAAMFAEVAGMLSEQGRAEKVMQGWDAGRSLVWSHRAEPNRQVAVGVLRFVDTAAARAYVGLAVDLQRKQDELLNAACAGRGGVLDSRSESLHLNRADEAVRAVKKVRLSDKTDAVSMTQVWVRAGERVVEFTWQGVPADTEWAQRVLDVVLKDK